MIKNLVVHNIIVVNETEKTFSLYNTGELFGEPGCYLERFFYKKDITVEQLIKTIETVLYKKPELLQKLGTFIQKPIKEWERPADSTVKTLIDEVRVELGLNDATLSERLAILSEIKDEVNSFSQAELSESFDSLDLEYIEHSPNVDVFIKQRLEEIKQLKGMSSELDEINSLPTPEKIESKKTMVSLLKKVGKVTIVAAILLGFGLGSMEQALARSSSSSSSRSSSSYSSSSRSSSSSSSSSRSSSSSSSSSRGSSSSSKGSSSSSSAGSFAAGVVVGSVTSSPSWSNSTEPDKNIVLTSTDVIVSTSTRVDSNGSGFIKNSDIIGLRAEVVKKWDSGHTHYKQNNISKFGQEVSTATQTYYVVESYGESVNVKGENISVFDSVYVKLSNGQDYKLVKVSGPTVNTNVSSKINDVKSIPVTNLSLVDSEAKINLNLGNITGFSYATQSSTDKNLSSSYSGSNNILTNNVERTTHIQAYQVGTIGEVSETKELNINVDNSSAIINGIQLKAGDQLTVTANGKTVKYLIVNKITEATKNMIYSIILGILGVIGATALITFVGPIVLSVLGDSKVALTGVMKDIADKIKKARSEMSNASELSDNSEKVNKKTVEDITNEVLDSMKK